MNRKAIGWSTAAALILGLAFLLVILIFLFKIGTKSNNIVEDSECKSSIMSHYVIKKMTREVLVSDIYCPTKYYNISGKNDDETKRQLADALKSCWGTWGRGELDLFEDEALYCHMCSVIDFKENDRIINGFGEYLMIMQADDSGVTYMDYLAGYSSKDADSTDISKLQRLESIKYDGTIDTSKRYAVVFVYARGKDAIKKIFDFMDLLGLGAIGGGATTGLATGVGLAVLGVTSGGTAVVVAGVLVAAGAIVGAITADDADWVSTTMFMDYEAPVLKDKLQCEISPARQDKIQKALG